MSAALQGLGADLGLALLHSLWQVALLAAALKAALTLLHRASPKLRHGLAMLALAGAVAWPADTFAGLRGARAAAFQENIEHPQAWQAPSSPPAETPLLARLEAAARPALPWLALAWMAGALAFALRFAGGWLWLAALRRRAARAPQELHDLAAGLARRMGIRAPDLRVMEGLGPFSFGLFRSTVILPAACLANLDARSLEAVLAHEFAHLRRLDFALNALQSLAEALLFHHPLAWWISAAARLERERCCDQAAVGVCGDARFYAAVLNRLDDLRPPLAATAAQGAPLMIRIKHLLGAAARPSRPALFGASLTLLGLGLAAAVPLAQAVSAPAILVPKAVLDQVDAAAEAQHLDPALLRAMVQCESGYDASARSSAGSIGLLQVMPQTGARYGFSAEDLKDPAKNLQAGAAYLRFLLDHYKGDTQKAVTAYNAGEKAVDAAHGQAPAEESRRYAEAVMELYQRKAIQPTDAAEGEQLVQGHLEPANGGGWSLSFSGFFTNGYEADLTMPGHDPVKIMGGWRLPYPLDKAVGTSEGVSTNPASPKIIFTLGRGPAVLTLLDKGSHRKGSIELDPDIQDFTVRLKK